MRIPFSSTKTRESSNICFACLKSSHLRSLLSHLWTGRPRIYQLIYYSGASILSLQPARIWTFQLCLVLEVVQVDLERDIQSKRWQPLALTLGFRQNPHPSWTLQTPSLQHAAVSHGRCGSGSWVALPSCGSRGHWNYKRSHAWGPAHVSATRKPHSGQSLDTGQVTRFLIYPLSCGWDGIFQKWE